MISTTEDALTSAASRPEFAAFGNTGTTAMRAREVAAAGLLRDHPRDQRRSRVRQGTGQRRRQPARVQGLLRQQLRRLLGTTQGNMDPSWCP
jgi:hypothetical protein